MPKCDFNKVVKHGCPSINLLQIFGTPFAKKTSGRLLWKIDHKWLIFRQSIDKYVDKKYPQNKEFLVDQSTFLFLIHVCSLLY